MAKTYPMKWLGILAAVLVSAVSILVSAGFRRPPPPAPAVAPGMSVAGSSVSLTPEAPQWRALRLDTARPATAGWTDQIPARIKIDEAKASKLGTPLDGRVVTVFVEFGQTVKKGEPLFLVASPSLAELRAEQEKAAVDFEVAKAELDRIQAMVGTHALPAKDQMVAEQQYRQAQVGVKLAAAKLASLNVSSRGENQFTVKAPRDGVVVEKNVIAGQEVSSDSGEPLISIADLSSVWVVADLFEEDADAVQEGAKAEVTSPALPNVKLEGKVDIISSVADPARHTVPVRVRLDNLNRLLKPNVYARVRFETQPPSGSVTVPATSLISDGEHQYVFVQDQPGHFARREITAGSTQDDKVPVLAGLTAGETVVVEGGILLDNQVALSD